MGMTTSNTQNDFTTRTSNPATVSKQRRPKNRSDVGWTTPEIGDTVSPAPGSNGTRAIVDTVPQNAEIELPTAPADVETDSADRPSYPNPSVRNDSTGTAGISGLPLVNTGIVKARDMVDSLRGYVTADQIRPDTTFVGGPHASTQVTLAAKDAVWQKNFGGKK